MEKDYGALFNEAFNKKEDLTEFAEIFSEGDELLKKTLLNLWKNNIRTFSCCMGHETEVYSIPAYLSLIIDENSINLIEILYSKLYPEKKDIEFMLDNRNFGAFDGFTIHMKGDTKEYVLNLINQCLGIKLDVNNKDLANSLEMLKFANEAALRFEIQITKKTTYLEFRKPTDDTSYIEFKSLEESTDELKDINNVSHLFIECNNDDLDKINNILKNPINKSIK